MSAQDEPGAPDERGSGDTRLRWLGRAAVVAVALWFIADGLSGVWSGGDTLARVLIVVAVVLGVAFAGFGILYLARRGREG